MSDTVLYKFSVFLRLSALMGFFASDIPPCGKIKVVVVLIIATKYFTAKRTFFLLCVKACIIGFLTVLVSSLWLIHITRP